ncbi:MAG TPA: outer membrane beta-barrel protein [Nevskiaceae bacterium]|nr:outer membrane beta-barrel protein [Nevskiaceae bacterium]
MFKLKTVVAAAGLMALPALSQAAAPTLSDVLDASSISVTGHATGSYAYQKVNPPAPAASSAVNSFGFDQAELMVSKLPASGFGAAVDVFAGQDVTGGSINYGGLPGGAPTVAAFNKFGAGGEINLHQAYVQYATGALTVIGGKYATLAGSEVASDVLNSNATRSILFDNQPFTLTGVRAGYKFSDMITGYLGFANSAGGATADFNDQKTTEIGVALAPLTGLTVNVTDYIGNEGAAGSGNKTNLLDLVVGYTAGDLNVGLNADRNTSHGPAAVDLTFTGVALYANYQVMPSFRAGRRGEITTTKDDVAATKTKQDEVTLTGDYSGGKNFDLVTDLRYDALKFEPSGSTAHAVTFLTKAIFKF